MLDNSLFVRHRAVFFDLVGTLIYGREPIGTQYAAVATRLGIEAEASRLDREFRRAMREAPTMAFPGRTIEETAVLERKWWQDLVRVVVESAGVTALEDRRLFDRYFEELFDHFTTPDAWVLYPDVMEALAHLSHAGISIGLITNYDTRVYPVLDALGLTPFLDSVTIPADVGAAKPDPSIFAHALTRHGLGAAEAVFVGDSWEDDYLGSASAGLTAILLDREGRDASRPSVRRITTLTDLTSLLP